jgi:hypothetical protein
MTELLRTHRIAAARREPLPAVGLPPLKMVLVQLKDEPLGLPGAAQPPAATTPGQTEAEAAALRLIVRLIEHFDRQA